MKDGSEKPITFASRMLTNTEINYSQIEKEALGLVFGVIFHLYLYGRTALEPLKNLGPETGVPTLAADRIPQWSFILAAYTYETQYKKSEQHGNADALFRLPLSNCRGPTTNPVNRMSFIDDLPVTAKDVALETERFCIENG